MGFDMDFNAGVIGYPVEHSLSPAIHNAVYAAQGVPWRYGLVPAPAEADVREAVQAARGKALFARGPEEMFCGFNVTTPYKGLAYELADRLNPSARLVGFANTLTLAEECDEFSCKFVLSADTTDGEGACRALANSGFAVPGIRMLVLGTGGAAASIMAAAYLNGASRVYVASRDVERARSLIAAFGDRGDELSSHGILEGWGFGLDRRNIQWRRPEADGSCVAVSYEGISCIARSSDIIVNATPLGMKASDPSPLPADSFRPGQMVMDAVYAHGLTAFLADAQRAGAVTMDGLPMLVEQALLTVKVWFEANGRPFDAEDPANYGALEAAGIVVPRPGGGPASAGGDA